MSDFCNCGHSEWRHQRFTTSCMAPGCHCDRFVRKGEAMEPPQEKVELAKGTADKMLALLQEAWQQGYDARKEQEQHE